MDDIVQIESAKAITALNDALTKNNYEGVRNIIASAVSSASCAPWDLVSWLLSKVDDSTVKHSVELENLLKTNVSELSQSLSAKEFVLILLSKVESSNSLCVLTFSMPFLEYCALSFGLSDYLNTHLIFKSIQTKLHAFISGANDPFRPKFAKYLNVLIRGISHLFHCMFSKTADKNDALIYSEDVLYYFSETLYFVGLNEDTMPVFRSFISVLQITGPPLYSRCYELLQFSNNCSDVIAASANFADREIALLHALGLCLTSFPVCSFWPTIFTKEYELKLFVCIASSFVQKIERFIADGSFLSRVDVKRLIRTQEHLISLASKLRRCLPSTWWTSFPISLIRNFEAISKYPISSESLPVEVKNCVLAIEALLSSASITACCELFIGIMDRSIKPFHCGLRSHMIVLFKNFLNDTLLILQDGRRNDLLIAENLVGESSVTLPFDFDYLRGMCDLIFQYPLPGCDDSLFDQSSWLMAALNLAIYVNIRTRSISALECSAEIKEISHGVALAFSRPDAKGRSTLKTRFLDPLSSDVASISNRYKMAEREHEANPDPMTISPNAPSLHDCQLYLLRFRLLMDTVSRVGEFPVA
ncbi:hypothetical protein EGR_04737 [Echinococcus granulosus]|uniref:Uncharacterized protein n=1 Tax=Echinococcus granulosus TaxID=6210 RepID=U6J5L6_ECHGR|nr:hypothetical protein EGR_04737 [Echinococcus granulosus]EUB60355.1 hypothetical protein EGR_04737 [Echinococcus granulosus]CDS19342.1 hypothetical protein EgrG_000463800 [Echinococcus granulosus]